jgi:glycosyltransferase involved in cell wall biosynthesis
VKSPRVHIVIPVHNGEASLGASLAALARQLSANIRVSIVLNGCTDGSRDVIASWIASITDTGAQLRVLDLPEASRVAALNAAEKDATGDEHMVFVDHDAVLSDGALSAILTAFERGFHFTAGRAVWRSPSSIVLMAMRAWDALPYVRLSPVTAGLYAVSSAGRRRWGRWPDGLPDDKLARLQFDRADRVRLEEVTYTVDAPRSLADLLAARRRYAASNVLLSRSMPHLKGRDLKRHHALHRLMLQPRLWSGALVLAHVEARAWLSLRK